ncbi:MAG: hypothetical protein JJU06_03010 [Ectothiorhodospiraceae bacterium]|nr:hypothetical protein [Ectothiorhodospiraceae bacterium]
MFPIICRKPVGPVAVLCLLILLPAAWFPAEAIAVGDDRLSFSVRFRDDINPYRVFGLFVMPGEHMELEVVRGREGNYLMSDPGGFTRVTGRARWEWSAPQTPGLHVLRVTRLDTQEIMTLNVFVKVPRHATRQGRINGYRVGHYPQKPLRGLAVYEPPPGFIEVTPATRSVHVSPHFTLGQFVSKQGGNYPRYVVLRERLLLLLEAILEEVRAEGIPADTLTIMSGFRTPWYNASIGQGEFSRHIWGGAADIYIDQRAPHGRMDDLNGDGRSDVNDARLLASIVERVQRRRGPVNFIGGLGIYGPRPHRGPFVHVDVRGFEARWEYP